MVLLTPDGRTDVRSRPTLETAFTLSCDLTLRVIDLNVMAYDYDLLVFVDDDGNYFTPTDTSVDDVLAPDIAVYLAPAGWPKRNEQQPARVYDLSGTPIDESGLLP